MPQMLRIQAVNLAEETKTEGEVHCKHSMEMYTSKTL